MQHETTLHCRDETTLQMTARGDHGRACLEARDFVSGSLAGAIPASVRC